MVNTYIGDHSSYYFLSIKFNLFIFVKLFCLTIGFFLNSRVCLRIKRFFAVPMIVYTMNCKLKQLLREEIGLNIKKTIAETGLWLST